MVRELPSFPMNAPPCLAVFAAKVVLVMERLPSAEEPAGVLRFVVNDAAVADGYLSGGIGEDAPAVTPRFAAADDDVLQRERIAAVDGATVRGSFPVGQSEAGDRGVDERRRGAI